MIQPTKLIILFVVFATGSLFAAPAFGNDWTGLPELEPREQIAIQRGYDGPRYNPLRQCFRQADSLVDAGYYGTLVMVTDPGGSSSRDHSQAHEYAQFAAQQWSQEGRVDLETDVVIAVGFRNRSLGVYVGERWQKMGWTDDLLAQTLAASNFDRHMRRQSYGDVMCSALHAIDHRLAILEKEHGERLEVAKKTFPEAQERFAGVHDAVEEALPADNEMRALLTDRLDSADQWLAMSERIEEAPHQVIPAAEQITRVADDVEADLERYLEKLDPLDDLENRIEAALAAIGDRDDSDWDGPVAATQILEECRQMATHTRLAKDPDLLEIQDCLHGAEVELARSDERHYFLAGAIPRAIFILLVVLALALLAARILRRRRTSHVLRPDLEAWRGGLEQRGEQLAQLRSDFPWYFADRNQFWQGESADVDRAIADGINRAFLLHKRGLELFEKANTLHSKSKILDVRKLDKALKLLRQTTIGLAGGAAESERPLTLPLTADSETQACELFNELDAAYFQALQGLRQAAPLQEQLDALFRDAEAAYRAAAAEIETRQNLNLPTEHLSASLGAARQIWSQAKDLADQRPEQAASSLEEAVQSLEEVRERAADGNQILSLLQEDVAGLRHKVNTLLDQAKRKGIEFADTDFDPTMSCEITEGVTAQIVDFVASGHEDLARESLEPLIADLEDTVLRLSVCIEASGIIPSMIEQVESAKPKFKEPLFKIRMKLQRLDDDERGELADHISELGRLQQINPRIDRVLKGIDDAHSKGKTLRAIADLAALVQVLESGAQSLAELERCLEEADSDGPPAPPPAPLWMPPQGWHQNSASIWGRSPDADHFRTLSLPGKSSARSSSPATSKL